MKTQVFIIVALLSLQLRAQFETINWYVASNTLLNFTSTPASVSNTFPLTGVGLSPGSTLSDAAGNLKVITRGGLVYNAQGQLVAPQIASVSAGTGEQSGLVIPMPGNPNLHYIFFVSGINNFNGKLLYSVFDPTLAAGAGSLTVMSNTVNANTTFNGLCGVRHCNGKDVWLICGQASSVTLTSYNVYAYLLTAAGINTVPVVSSINGLSDPNATGIGFLRPSPDGRRLAIGARRNVFPATYSVTISDFDRATGTLNNTYLARTINNAQGGLSYYEFSPDGSKLYTVEYPSTIVQLDFCAGSPTAVVASANTVATLPAVSTYSFYRGIQRAINGQIYLSQWNTSQGFSNNFAAIQQPNNFGTACAFSLNAQSIGTGTYSGYLPHYANYLMKPLITIGQAHQSCSRVTFNAPSTVCATAGTSLSTMTWNFGEPVSPSNTSTLNSPTHNYSGAGNYQVKLILDDGQCVADTLYQQITVLPNTTLNIGVNPLSQTLCPGQTITLTASGATGYTWMPGALSGSQVVVSPQSTTTYTIRGGDNIGCENSNTVSLSLYPVASVTVTASPKTLCAGQTATLTASGASSYSWSTGAVSQSLTATPANTTVYTITSIGAYSCSAVSMYTLSVSKCAGLEGLIENRDLFSVYPNPVTETLKLEIGILNEGSTRIEIENAMGQIIYSKQNFLTQRVEIDLQDRPKGIYFIKLVSGPHHAVKMLILE